MSKFLTTPVFACLMLNVATWPTLAEESELELWVVHRLTVIEIVLLGATGDEIHSVKRDLAVESVDCLVFYQILAARMSHKQNEDFLKENASLIDGLEATSANLYGLAALLYNDVEVTDAEVSISSRQMVEGILKKDYDRLPILTEKYGPACKDLVERPHRRVLHWMKQEGITLKLMTEEEINTVWD